ncbi:MAG: hypothetical protein H0X45_01090 [Planctomycetes bacterium]|nr:hypothetical protein [Planctomycetota bacterium]
MAVDGLLHAIRFVWTSSAVGQHPRRRTPPLAGFAPDADTASPIDHREDERLTAPDHRHFWRRVEVAGGRRWHSEDAGNAG